MSDWMSKFQMAPTLHPLGTPEMMVQCTLLGEDSDVPAERCVGGALRVGGGSVINSSTPYPLLWHSSCSIVLCSLHRTQLIFL